MNHSNMSILVQVDSGLDLLGWSSQCNNTCCWDNSGKDVAPVMTILFGLIKVIKWALGIRKLIVLERCIIPRHAMTLVMNLSLLNIIYIIFIVCYNIVYHLAMGTAFANVHDHDFPIFFGQMLLCIWPMQWSCESSQILCFR